MTLFQSIKQLCSCLLITMVVGTGTGVGAQSQNQSRDFVLVHGAWVGEWYWEGLVKGLEMAGHRAIAVSLTGHGKRAAEGGPHVTIDMHAQDIADAVGRHGMNDVILVGHSYGGRPVTAAWDLLRDRVAHVVYVESVAPTNDDILAIPQDNTSMRFVLQNYPAWVEEGMIPVPMRLHQAYDQLLAPQSIRSVYGDVKLKNGVLPKTKGTYIYATSSRARVFRSYGKRLQDWRGWELVEISGGHHVMADGGADMLKVLTHISEANKP